MMTENRWRIQTAFVINIAGVLSVAVEVEVEVEVETGKLAPQPLRERTDTLAWHLAAC